MPVPGRHHPEVVEGALGELEELVALDVALQLELDVEPEGVLGAVVVHLHRVIDHQVAGDDGVDLVGVALHAGHRVAHRGEVHHAGHAGEVLEDDAGGHEGNLGLRRPFLMTAAELADVVLGDDPAAGEAEGVLEEDADGEGEAVEVGDALFGQLGQPIDDGAWPYRVGGCRGSRRGWWVPSRIRKLLLENIVGSWCGRAENCEPRSHGGHGG